MDYSKYSNGNYQDAVSKMWGDNCLTMCNEFIEYLQQNDDHDYTEEVLNISGGREDWQTPAIEHAESMDIEEFTAYCENVRGMAFYSDDETIEDVLADDDEAEEFCDHYNISPEYDEVFQWFIVSDWLAHKLEEKGQLVEQDIMGFTVWGRQCCGQAVYLDSVICNIYDDVYGDNWKEEV